MSIVGPDDRTKAGQPMEIEHWFSVVRRRWVLLASAVVGCLVLAVVLALVQEPVYEATAEVELGPSASASLLGASGSSPGLSSELRTAGSADVEKRVDERLGEGSHAVEVEADEESSTLSFTGSGSTAQEAADVANAWAEAFVEVRQRRTQADYDAALAGLQDKLDDVEELIAGLALPPADADERAVLQAQRAAYRDAIDQIEVASTVGGASSARVVEGAEPPDGKTSPLLGSYLAYGLLAGLVLGVGLVGVVEFFDRSVRGTEGARTAAGVPVLGRVRRRPGASGPRALLADRGSVSADGEATAGTGVLVLDAPASAEAEEFRSLRTTALSMLDAARPFVQVTGASSGDGATLVAANLAAAIAQSGQPTVLVSLVGIEGLDLPLRKIKQRDPLTAFLTGAAPTTACMAPVAGLDNLTVIAGPSGTVPDGAARRSMSEALEQLQALSRTVVLLSPPLLSTAHALEVSPLVDGTILVAREGSTSSADLAEASRSLELMEALVLGVVLT